MEEGYEYGKIYKIVCNISGEVYIGSTKNTLEDRLRKHNYLKDCVSRNILERGDYEILLIKDYPCNSRYELEEEETKYIKNNKCINKNLPHRTQQQYREDNKEEINKQRKKYREINKEEINKKKLEKVECECGILTTKTHLARHKKTKKHINLMNKI